jgi:kynurenine formamidase
MNAHAGISREGALWLYEQGMCALGTDTTATEPCPLADLERTRHVAMLVDRGVPLLEILDLDGLAAERVFELLFVCTPLKFVGATGSWVRPIAIT